MSPKLVSAGAACLLLLSPIHGSTVASRSRDDAVIKEIVALENARNEAILRGDAATLSAMTSDDYTFITIRGELRAKAEIVKGFATGTFKYDWRQISDMSVRVYGDTAIVTGRASQKGAENEKDYSGAYRFTLEARDYRG